MTSTSTDIQQLLQNSSALSIESLKTYPDLHPGTPLILEVEGETPGLMLAARSIYCADYTKVGTAVIVTDDTA